MVPDNPAVQDCCMECEELYCVSFSGSPDIGKLPFLMAELKGSYHLGKTFII